MAEATHGASGGGPDYNTDDDVWVNRIIKQLVLNAALSALDASKLCCKAWDIFSDQPQLLGLQTPMKVCGNIGGHTDLLSIFSSGGYPPEVRPVLHASLRLFCCFPFVNCF